MSINSTGAELSTMMRCTQFPGNPMDSTVPNVARPQPGALMNTVFGVIVPLLSIPMRTPLRSAPWLRPKKNVGPEAAGIVRQPGAIEMVWLPVVPLPAPRGHVPITVLGGAVGVAETHACRFQVGPALKLKMLYVVEITPQAGAAGRVAVTRVAQSFGPPDVPVGFEQPSPRSGIMSPRNSGSVPSGAFGCASDANRCFAG